MLKNSRNLIKSSVFLLEIEEISIKIGVFITNRGKYNEKFEKLNIEGILLKIEG